MKRPRWMPRWNEYDATIVGVSCVMAWAPVWFEKNSHATLTIGVLWLLAQALLTVDLNVKVKKEAAEFDRCWRGRK